MSPEEIFDAAAELGVICDRASDGTLKYHGTPPANFVDACTPWIPYREAFLEYLKEPKPQTSSAFYFSFFNTLG